MLVLHGSWLPERTRFYLWAERTEGEERRRGRKPAVPPHPFAAPAEALTAACRTLALDLSGIEKMDTAGAWLIGRLP